MCGPEGRKEKNEARDTLALPAKGFALCTPIYEWMSLALLAQGFRAGSQIRINQRCLIVSP